MIKKNLKNTFFYFGFFITFLSILARSEIIFGSDKAAPFADDFYYYLVTAKNFIHLGYPTFDTINLTNGFQPLWFLVITLFTFIFGDGVFFNFAIFFVIGLLSFLIFAESKNYLLNQGYSNDASLFISSFMSFLTLFFSKGGMEIALVNYFIILSLSSFKKKPFIFCLVLFLTFLARLDSIWIIIFLFLSYFFIYQYNTFRLFTFAVLVSIYLAINFFIFGSILPDSGLAKSLNNSLLFNLETFNFLFIENSKGYRFISLLFLINIIGILLLPFLKAKKETYIFIFSTLIFFFMNSLRSSWKLWDWHFYYLSFSTPFIIYEFIKKFQNYLQYIYYCVVIFFISAHSYLFIKDYNINNDHMLNLATKISDHYNNNQNIFAMGDMAGKVSFLLKKPLIQLEGLVSGKKILNMIREQRSLCDLFNEFKVDIYLTSVVSQKNFNYQVFEPDQVGRNGKKMTGILVGHPDKIFSSGSLNIYAFNLKKNKCVDVNIF